MNPINNKNIFLDLNDYPQIQLEKVLFEFIGIAYYRLVLLHFSIFHILIEIRLSLISLMIM